MNNSLFVENDLKQKIVDEIELVISTYACTPYHPNFIKNFRLESFDFMIDMELFWNVLLAQLRGIIIEYASKKKKKNNQKEKNLLKK